MNTIYKTICVLAVMAFFPESNEFFQTASAQSAQPINYEQTSSLVIEQNDLVVSRHTAPDVSSRLPFSFQDEMGLRAGGDPGQDPDKRIPVGDGCLILGVLTFGYALYHKQRAFADKKKKMED